MDIQYNEIAKREIERNMKEKEVPKNTLPPAFKVVHLDRTSNINLGPAPTAPVTPVSTY